MAAMKPNRTAPWAKALRIKPSSIVGGGTSLLDENGKCIGQVMVLAVEPERRAEFEDAVTRCLQNA